VRLTNLGPGAATFRPVVGRSLGEPITVAEGDEVDVDEVTVAAVLGADRHRWGLDKMAPPTWLPAGFFNCCGGGT